MANAIARRGLVSAGLVWALCALNVQAAGESYVVPGSRAATLDKCVESTDFMRRNHMEVIKHQRDETVRNGIRSTKHSLAGCIECHVSYGSDGAAVAASGEGQFCAACHEYAAAGMNCFGCHSATPDGAVDNAVVAGEADGQAWHPPVGAARIVGPVSGSEAVEEGNRP